MNLDSAWKHYQRHRDVDSRDAIVHKYLSLVSLVARKISSTLPSYVERGDLESVGFLGLLDAIDKFDPSRNIAFETYAKLRITGAIMDELRSMDWIPRSVRQKTKQIEKAYQDIAQRLGRPAQDREVAKELNISISQLNQLMSEISGTTLFSLEQIYYNDEGERSLNLMDRVDDANSADPLDTMEKSELKQTFVEAINQLPEKEKLVIALYYYECLTLKEIGMILGLTESRISQIHTKAILKLRSRLRTITLKEHSYSIRRSDL
jgi:RNA polymerase sigma factor for flagellar operon FliA